MPSIRLNTVARTQVSARGNQRIETIFQITADTYRWKIVRDWKSGLTQEPKSPDTGLSVSVLPPHCFIIRLAGPLDFHSDFMLSFLGEDVSCPLLARRAVARHLGCRLPAVSASRVDHSFFQLEMRFRFGGGHATADSLVSEKLGAEMRSLQDDL
jgi:hypothetical protein